MKFLPRAAVLAAVTFCAGALANAATVDATAQSQTVQDQLNQDLNAPNGQIVPAAPAKVAEAPVPVEPQASKFTTLSAAVDAQDLSASDDSELNCLAVGVYYEAKGEPLAGQLAVAEVILDRAASGRFPHSVCSVLKQPGQFSFVRGGRLPAVPANAAWRKAVAVAQVARKDLWESPVDGALYFHARYVRPSWKRAKVGAIGNHVFYR